MRPQVILFDVRSADLFQHSHIEGAINIPCGQNDMAENCRNILSENSSIQAVLDKVTPGALEQAFAAVKPTSMVGSCVIAYDSIGDSMDSVGPAATFADILAECDIVPEVGRLAGGFQAFQELGGSSVWCEEVCSGRNSHASCASDGSRMSRALTPKQGYSQSFPPIG